MIQKIQDHAAEIALRDDALMLLGEVYCMPKVMVGLTDVDSKLEDAASSLGNISTDNTTEHLETANFIDGARAIVKSIQDQIYT